MIELQKQKQLQNQLQRQKLCETYKMNLIHCIDNELNEKIKQMIEKYCYKL